MKRWESPKPLFVVIVLLILHSTLSAAASDDTYRSAFIEHLEMGPPTYLKIDVHGKTAADIDKRLSELYYDNGLYPLWIEDGTPGSRAADTLAVLDEAGSGLYTLPHGVCGPGRWLALFL